MSGTSDTDKKILLLGKFYTDSGMQVKIKKFLNEDDKVVDADAKAKALAKKDIRLGKVLKTREITLSIPKEIAGSEGSASDYGRIDLKHFAISYSYNGAMRKKDFGNWVDGFLRSVDKNNQELPGLLRDGIKKGYVRFMGYDDGLLQNLVMWTYSWTAKNKPDDSVILPTISNNNLQVPNPLKTFVNYAVKSKAKFFHLIYNFRDGIKRGWYTKNTAFNWTSTDTAVNSQSAAVNSQSAAVNSQSAAVNSQSATVNFQGSTRDDAILKYLKEQITYPQFLDEGHKYGDFYKNADKTCPVPIKEVRKYIFSHSVVLKVFDVAYTCKKNTNLIYCHHSFSKNKYNLNNQYRKGDWCNFNQCVISLNSGVKLPGLGLATLFFMMDSGSDEQDAKSNSIAALLGYPACNKYCNDSLPLFNLSDRMKEVFALLSGSLRSDSCMVEIDPNPRVIPPDATKFCQQRCYAYTLPGYLKLWPDFLDYCAFDKNYYFAAYRMARKYIEI